ncbi:sigma factor [Nonomuraea pusilla]|uniref:DNA-directed RNA polymerase specialized sigma subunit, sigma24 family n=1 Tax=Nonomuraea pusilla TaxID=46177 RepID=A0A1H8I6R7_9ACTN|nr:sigma factor [Nonomuraea pusilla]SEN64034.1 DNA-directed RNA polymerase specialized sigma subunit, sigma24 family [Nonomuraea pusilla]
MPGWPTVDRSDDEDLADALRRGASGAPAALCDAYAERLHDYAYRLIGDQDSAADAVHDALVTAHAHVGRLREPGLLRPWLYALTRSQVRARLAHRTPAAATVPLPGPFPGPFPDPGDEADGPDPAALLAELGGNEREILELSLRHGLTPGEVGPVLGLTSRQAAARLGRARDRLENAAAAVVLARTGRAHCPALSAMLDCLEGPLPPELRRRLSAHIAGCEVCTEGRHRRVSAARLLARVPVAFPPAALRRRVVETCLDPGRGPARTLIVERGDSFDRAGFPTTDGRRSRRRLRSADGRRPRRRLPTADGRRSGRRRPRRIAPVLLAGASVLAATGAVVAVTGAGAPDARTASAPSVSREAAPGGEPVSASPEPLMDDEPAPEPSAAETVPSATPSAPPARRPSPRATTPRARPAASPAATRRGPAPAARLAVTCPDAIDGAAKIGLRARNAPVSWTAAASGGLTVFPASGTVKAGASAALVVTIDDPDAPGAGRVSLTSNGGGATCALSWDGAGPEASEPPPDRQSPTPGPSDSPTAPATADAAPESLRE